MTSDSKNSKFAVLLLGLAGVGLAGGYHHGNDYQYNNGEYGIGTAGPGYGLSYLGFQRARDYGYPIGVGAPHWGNQWNHNGGAVGGVGDHHGAWGGGVDYGVWTGVNLNPSFPTAVMPPASEFVSLSQSYNYLLGNYRDYNSIFNHQSDFGGHYSGDHADSNDGGVQVNIKLNIRTNDDVDQVFGWGGHHRE